MKPLELLDIIISLDVGDKIDLFDGIGIELVSYSGLVAKSGWNQEWKYFKHKNRSELGLFDFKALLNENPPSHKELLTEAIKILNQKEVREIYINGDPESFDDQGKKKLLQLIQLLFLEQEVNYGYQIFQAWTKMKAPRNFFMAYLLRSLDLPYDEAVEFINKSTDKYGVIRVPPNPDSDECKFYLN